MLGRVTSRPYRFPLLVAIALAAVGFLVVQGAESTGAYYMEVSELLAKGDAAQGERVRVMGKVVPGSIERDARTLRFTASDATGRLRVAYDGVVPDIFKDGVDVVVEGVHGRDGAFSADVLLAKCPSKFESDPSAPAEASR